MSIPAAPPPSPGRVPRVGRATLGNGIDVITVRRRSVPLVEMRLRVPFAARTATQHARSTLVAETLLAGTRRRDATGIAVRLEELGATLGVSAGVESLTLSGSTLARHLAPYLDLVAEILTSATFPARRVANEQRRLLDELLIRRAQPQTIVEDTMASRFYGSHPYGLGLPSPEALAAATPAAVRRRYRVAAPAGATLVLVGDVARGPTLAAAAALEAWAGGAGTPPHPTPPQPEPGPVLLIDRPGAHQTNIRVSAPVPGRTHPEHTASVLAELVFGGYFSSRLSLNLREDKGYGYSPRSGLVHRGAASRFQAVVDVATLVTAPALLELRYEMGRMAATPVPDRELDDARRYRVGALANSTQTQAGLAGWLQSLAFAGLTEHYLRDHPAQLARTGAEQVLEVSRRMFAADRAVTVMVGDAALITPLLEPIAEVILRP